MPECWAGCSGFRSRSRHPRTPAKCPRTREIAAGRQSVPRSRQFGPSRPLKSGTPAANAALAQAMAAKSPGGGSPPMAVRQCGGPWPHPWARRSPHACSYRRAGGCQQRPRRVPRRTIPWRLAVISRDCGTAAAALKGSPAVRCPVGLCAPGANHTGGIHGARS